jgi:hypothetical protein
MGTLVSSTNKTDFYDIAKILLKVVLNTIILSPKPKVDIILVVAYLIQITCKVFT